MVQLWGPGIAVPAGEELEGWSAEELVGEEIDFLHDVGQSDRKLLPQEHKRGLLACICRACSHMRKRGGGKKKTTEQAFNFDPVF